ncbi:hypothetical protein D3C72_930210 [compost metagenome]
MPRRASPLARFAAKFEAFRAYPASAAGQNHSVSAAALAWYAAQTVRPAPWRHPHRSSLARARGLRPTEYRGFPRTPACPPETTGPAASPCAPAAPVTAAAARKTRPETPAHAHPANPHSARQSSRAPAGSCAGSRNDGAAAFAQMILFFHTALFSSVTPPSHASRDSCACMAPWLCRAKRAAGRMRHTKPDYFNAEVHNATPLVDMAGPVANT